MIIRLGFDVNDIDKLAYSLTSIEGCLGIKSYNHKHKVIELLVSDNISEESREEMSELLESTGHVRPQLLEDFDKVSKINLKSLITLDNVKELDLSSYIGVTPNRRVKGRKYFIVLRDINIELSNGLLIKIEKGFSFDGSSTKFLSFVLPQYGAFLLASLIHDWMYVNDFMADTLGGKFARRFADKEMYIWSQATNDYTVFNKVDNLIRYIGVFLFGGLKY